MRMNLSMQRIPEASEKQSTRIALAVLIAYVMLLGIGFVAELCHIQWILDLPLYKL